jgi:hypothetical protein
VEVESPDPWAAAELVADQLDGDQVPGVEHLAEAVAERVHTARLRQLEAELAGPAARRRELAAVAVEAKEAEGRAGAARQRAEDELAARPGPDVDPDLVRAAAARVVQAMDAARQAQDELGPRPPPLTGPRAVEAAAAFLTSAGRGRALVARRTMSLLVMVVGVGLLLAGTRVAVGAAALTVTVVGLVAVAGWGVAGLRQATRRRDRAVAALALAQEQAEVERREREGAALAWDGRRARQVAADQQLVEALQSWEDLVGPGQDPDEAEALAREAEAVRAAQARADRAADAHRAALHALAEARRAEEAAGDADDAPPPVDPARLAEL